jgi:hypothetical protein
MTLWTGKVCNVFSAWIAPDNLPFSKKCHSSPACVSLGGFVFAVFSIFEKPVILMSLYVEIYLSGIKSVLWL